MARSLNILQISPQFPFPEDDGGKIGIAGIFKSLSNSGNHITLAAYNDSEIENDTLDYAEGFGDVNIIKHNTQNTKMRIFKSFFSGKPLSFEKYYSEAVMNQLENLIKQDRFDIIQCEHSYLIDIGIILRKKFKIPLALRLHNIEWMIWQRYAETFSEFDPRRIYLQKQSNLVKEHEKRGIAVADIAFPITEIDKQRAKELAPKSKLVTVPPGVDLSGLKRLNNIQRKPYTMVIATTYRWIHNIDGIKWFIEKVLPLIKEKVPQAELNIIGKNPPNWFNNYSHLGVNVLGYVPEIQSHLSQAAVYIAPLFVGSGIRIKILEAMAMELPVVATKVSAEGIKDNYSNGLYVTDNEKEFAQAIIDLLENPETAEKIGKSAREYIKNNYTWENTAELMIKQYRKIIRSK